MKSYKSKAFGELITEEKAGFYQAILAILCGVFLFSLLYGFVAQSQIDWWSYAILSGFALVAGLIIGRIFSYPGHSQSRKNIYRQIIEHDSDVVQMVFNVDEQEFGYVSSNIEELLGYKAIDISPSYFRNCFSHEDYQEWLQYFETLAFLYSYPSKLNQYYLEGNFEAGLKLVPEVLQKLVRYERYVDPHRVMVFYYKIAYLYFGNREYNKALDFLNDIIHLKVGHLREDLQCYARLMQLLVHFELGNYELLEYLCNSVQRFLLKMKELNSLPMETLKFFRKIIKKPFGERDNAFLSFQKQLLKISKDPFEKRALIYLDIVTWVDSKINKKSLAQILKSKLSQK